jgi:hypothetical protein
LAGPRESFLKGFTFSPDGRFFAVGRRVDGKAPGVIVYEVGTGREHARVLFPGAAYIGAIAFAPDSKRLASASHDQWIRLWDVEAKRPLEPIEWTPSTDKVGFSPDGRRIAFGNSFQWVGVWDIQARRPAYTVGEKEALGVCCLAFSPDGRYLATGTFGGSAFLWNADTGARVHVLTVPTDGRRVAVEVTKPNGVKAVTFTGTNNPAYCLAFSPDSRTLAVGHADGALRLWETATGRLRFSRKLPVGLPMPGATVAFAPDGATLATAGPGASVLVWDVKALPLDAPGAGPLATSADAEALWRDLADRDAAVAYRAMRRLAVDRAWGLPLLRQRLARVRLDYDPAAIRRWIDQLDSDRFAEREQATAELRRVSDRGEADLRTALANAPSPEVRSRLAAILETLDNPADRPEMLRLGRCLEILEWDGSDEACQLIRDLAKQTPQSRLAVEADQSLKRLKERRR